MLTAVEVLFNTSNITEWRKLMKKLLLAATDRCVGKMYTDELNAIFGDYVDVSTIYLESNNSIQDIEKLNQADIILAASFELFYSMTCNGSIKVPLLPLEFALPSKFVEMLRSYPYNTSAAISLESPYVSFQALFLLRQYELNNLNLNIYTNNQTNSTEEIIITDGTPAINIDKNCQIISIGQRKISVQTIIETADKLNISIESIMPSLGAYSKESATAYCGTTTLINKYISKAMQAKALLDCTDHACMILDHNHFVVGLNSQLTYLFNIKADVIGEAISSIPEFKHMCCELTDLDECIDREVALPNTNRRLLLTKKTFLTSSKSDFIHIISFKDVPGTQFSDGPTRKQAAKKGHIAKFNFHDIKGSSIAIRSCIAKARRIAGIDKPTLITGESGTGKELFAQSIHNNSYRRSCPFVAINCAALPSSLLESELFGYEDGSFTGARKGGKVGLFEAANHGTLFLDEIGEMTPDTQSKLLRVLEEKEFMKVGSNEVITVDVKIIAATNKDLKKLVEQNKFRLDLFFRLNTIMLRIPPLRERFGDIEELIQYFLIRENVTNRKIHSDVIKFMLSYPWNGNVRELRNCVEYMSKISDSDITIECLPEYMLTYDENYRSNTVLFPSSHDAGFLESQAMYRVLEILSRKSQGRKSLLNALKLSNIYISEYRLRSITEALKDRGYILIGKGRAGAMITQKGIDALNKISAP